MSDWRSELHRKLDERRRAEDKQKADREAAKQRRLAEKERAEERRHNAKVDKHRRQYKCHICGEPSGGPNYNPGTLLTRNIEWGRDDDVWAGGHYEWDKPTDLWKCVKCGRWSCSKNNHIDVTGLCERCFKKGYMPGGRRRILGW
jgi:hypothetical protein